MAVGARALCSGVMAAVLGLGMTGAQAQGEGQGPVGLGYDPAWFRFGVGQPARLSAEGPAPRLALAWPDAGATARLRWALGGFELRADRPVASPLLLGLQQQPSELLANWSRAAGVERFSAEALVWGIGRRQGEPLPAPAEQALRPAGEARTALWPGWQAPPGVIEAVPVLAGFVLQREAGQGGVRRLAVGLAPQGGWPASEGAPPEAELPGWPQGGWQWQAAFEGAPGQGGAQRLLAQALWLPGELVARCVSRQGRSHSGPATLALAPGTRMLLQGVQMRRLDAGGPLQAWTVRHDRASGRLQLGLDDGSAAGPAFDWALAWCELRPGR